MKKSKFLKNSKDVLTRSFNPSKCKTSLRLAGSRLKLLRNKKEVQVKQMKREIARLLESGQDQTARIRVEHVIREEKMMDAYDLIEIYCELIVARLPIIESQKICPIDLKEAIASVVFASPRCGDVPELTDVRKHFKEKYGKDFTTAAVELRPESGVSRMLVEKLSAATPDGQTKIKILSAIAEEHNVNWDPKSFEERSVPASDLLNGSSTFGEESKLHVEPSHFEGPDIQVPQNHKVVGLSSNFTQVDNRTSPRAERLPSAGESGIRTVLRHEASPQGLGDGRAQLLKGDGDTIPPDRQRWNMNFKDATSAAQAAAESAELASMAARTAAELSSHGRIMRQYTESHNSAANILKGGPEAWMNSKFVSGQSFEELMNRSFSERTGSQNEQKGRIKHNNQNTDGRFKEASHGGTMEYNQSASFKSRTSIENDSLDHGVPFIDGYSRNNSLKEDSRSDMGMQRKSFQYNTESANDWLEKSENVGEERFGKQPSFKSSHSNIFYDASMLSNSRDQKFEYDAGEDTFLGFRGNGIHGETSRSGSQEPTTVVFDKSDSDSENSVSDTSPLYNDPRQGFHLPLSGQKSQEHFSTNTNSSRSSTSKTSKPSSSLFQTRKSSLFDFPERSMDGTNLDDSTPVTFDESDGPTSESDEGMNMSRHTSISRDFHSGQNHSIGSQFKDKSSPSDGSLLEDKGLPGFDRKRFSLSFDNRWKSEEEPERQRSQGKKLEEADPPAKFNFGKPSADQPDSVPKKTQMELNYTGNSTPESEETLNFEKLTGGFRHKGYNRPTYLKNKFDLSSSFNKESEETTATIARSGAPPAVESSRIISMSEHKKSRQPYLVSESDSNRLEEEESLRKKSDYKHEKDTPLIGKDVKAKPSSGASNSMFGPDNIDLDVEFPKESLRRTSHLRTGISRRTKAFSSSSGKNIYSQPQTQPQPQPWSETLDFDDGMDRKGTTSSISETPKRSESKRNSNKLEIYEQPTLTTVGSKPTKSKFWGPPEYSNLEEATPVIMQEPKIQLRSEAHDSHVSEGRKPTKSYSASSQQQFQYSKGNSGQFRNSEHPGSGKVASKLMNSRLGGAPDQHNSGKANSAIIQESNVTRSSSTMEGSPKHKKKTDASIRRENPKAGTLDKTSSNKDASNQNASHVHPKLPDYDSLVQFFQKNRS